MQTYQIAKKILYDPPSFAIKFKAQKRFTLIELMVVIAVIGVLAALAIPSFQDYTVCTRVCEGVLLAAEAKDYVTDDLVNGNAIIGASYNFSSTKNTHSIVVANDNSGVITMISNATPQVTVVMTAGQWRGSAFVAYTAGTVFPTNAIVGWQCTSLTVTNKNLVSAECS